MSENPKPLPASFLKGVLEEFGLQWTSIAIYSGLVFSAFGLDRYLNTGVWMAVTPACFVLAYVFRHDVSPRFPVVFWISISTLAALIAIPWLLIRGHQPVGDFMSSTRELSSAYVAAITVTPLAFSILSYRLRENLFGGPLPREIRDAIRESFIDKAFYKRSQKYRFTFLKLEGDGLRVAEDLSYTLINRTGRKARYTVGIIPTRAEILSIKATVGGVVIDTTNPAYRRGAAFLVDWDFPPRKPVAVKFSAELMYNSSDSEKFLSYVATTDFELIVDDRTSGRMWVLVEPLIGAENLQPQLRGTARTYRSPGATLPYHGFKVDWKPGVIAESPMEAQETKGASI